MSSVIYPGKRVVVSGGGASTLGTFLIPQGKAQRSGLRRAYSGYILPLPLIGNPNTTIVTRTR